MDASPIITALLGVITTLAGVISALYWNSDKRAQQRLERMEAREDGILKEIVDKESEMVGALKDLLGLMRELAEAGRETRIEAEVAKRVREAGGKAGPV